MSDSYATLPAVLQPVDRKIRKILGNRVHSVVETSKPLINLNKDLSLDHFEVYKRQRQHSHSTRIKEYGGSPTHKILKD